MSFCINKSGKTVPVYSSTSFSSQIGAIYQNECYSFIRSISISGEPFVEDEICFRGPNGSLLIGWCVCDNISTQRRSVLDYSFGGGTTNTGIYYSCTLKARAYLNIYDPAGTLIDFCYAGSKVLTDQNTTGDKNPHLLLIRAVERPAGSGIYYPVGGSAGRAFINTGLETCGSMSYNVGLYGNW